MPTTTRRANPTVTFSEEEKKLLQGFAHAVWDECAYDILQATAEEKGKDINAVTVSRAVAIEIALDAGRMEERMRSAKQRGHTQITDDLLDRIDKASYDQLIKVVRPAFAYARYGM